MPKKLSDRFLIVGGHPFRACMSHPNDHHRQDGYYEDETPQKTDGNSSERHEGDSNRSSPDEASSQDAEGCCCPCCRTDSPLYARCWPLIFFFSALTDFPLPLPKGKKPGQHRDWGWIPVVIVMGIVAFVYYGYLDHVCRKYIAHFVIPRCCVLIRTTHSSHVDPSESGRSGHRLPCATPPGSCFIFLQLCPRGSLSARQPQSCK
ncbi:hypothetical protein BCR43DRAFT_497858 [Syncephalastrum racemosum]|uniref:Uncharacterized protein n=1 Tax=Syncephalastrum racemosum TaxID=13706 RepID=A0A1X2H2Y7_SYNRA|nr:hypothetical protein BCR43DRAFT_497858 [Syncephalastrum racemosum]